MSEKIKISFDGMGRPTIEAVGFVGQSCTQATAALEKALGGGDPVRTLKPEFHQVETNEAETSQTQGSGWG